MLGTHSYVYRQAVTIYKVSIPGHVNKISYDYQGLSTFFN